MKLNNPTAEIFIPSNIDKKTALSRTTHLSIAAHHDDIEILAYHGIEKCYQNKNLHFTGVVVTNGSGSARDNQYKDYTNQEMMKVRKQEQKKAAYTGEYSAQLLLDYPSSTVKYNNEDLINELVEIISITGPQILYTHNLADKHDTHIGVTINTIKALRKMPKNLRPKTVYGCEVWRDLDWVNDNEKIFLDVSHRPNLAQALIEVFDSQITGGKRYDLATIGRRLSNATFSSSHNVDQAKSITYAIDLSELVENESLNITDYIGSYIDRFKQDVIERISKVL